jgi:hypothetical protein
MYDNKPMEQPALGVATGKKQTGPLVGIRQTAIAYDDSRPT